MPGGAMLIGQALHFGISLFIGLACLTAFWLYIDAWAESRHASEICKSLGFLVLTAGFLIAGASWDGTGWITQVSNWLRLLGYLTIATGNIMEPLQPLPSNTKPEPAGAAPGAPAATVFGVSVGLPQTVLILIPLSCLTVAILYWRRATTGLERHLKPLAQTFFVFCLAEILGLAVLARSTTNPLLQPVVAPLGAVWIVQHLALIAGAGLLARWVWRYLTKRLLSQMFLTITGVTFGIVLITTTSVSALLINSVEKDTLTSLTASGSALRYALDSQTARTQAGADVLAHDPAVIQSLQNRDHTAAANLVSAALVNKGLAEVIITDASGVVLSRASDPERTGDSLSNDALVQHALTDTTAASLTARPGLLNAVLTVTAATPVHALGRVIGLVLTTAKFDNSFVDGLKRNTALDSAIYSGAVESATTLTGQDGVSRAVGATETNAGIVQAVLKRGQNWQGTTVVGGQTYVAVYLPLKDIDNTVAGMLFVGQPQAVALSSAKQAVSLTFFGAVIALLIIIGPVYLLARQITRQIS